MGVLGRIIGAAKNLAPVRAYREARFERFFVSSKAYSTFRGVFPSFDAARASAPAGGSLGFDSEAFTSEYEDRLSRLFDYDYPVLFWLQSLLREGSRVFDIGGHVGVHFYAYQKVLRYPEGLRWTVCEVPAIAEAGRKRARGLGESRLDFTSDLPAMAGADVVIAAGSVQYIESPALPDVLAGLPHRPRHVILNKIPLYDGPAFVTLQNAGASFVPTRIFNRRLLLDGLCAAGYELVDSWENPGRRCHIAFHPERSFPAMSGVYLRSR